MKFERYLLHNKFRNATSSLAMDNFTTKVNPTAQKIKPMSDKEGLEKAYSLPNKLFINGDVLYVAGTSSLHDVWDDLKIPFHLTSQSQRYTDAEKILANNKQISTLVGHSLGSAVSLELQANMKDRNFQSRTYSVPTISSPFSTGDRL
jgi:hypothetical protein